MTSPLTIGENPYYLAYIILFYQSNSARENINGYETKQSSQSHQSNLSFYLLPQQCVNIITLIFDGIYLLLSKKNDIKSLFPGTSSDTISLISEVNIPFQEFSNKISLYRKSLMLPFEFLFKSTTPCYFKFYSTTLC